MFLTPQQTILTILAVAAGAILCRFLPFVLFPEKKALPKSILYFGRVLPPAILALLVVSCFKNTPILESPHGIPELIAAAVVCGLHLWKRKTLLSVFAGTGVYMLLVQLVF